jgi:hypothetical protein
MEVPRRSVGVVEPVKPTKASIGTVAYFSFSFVV